MLSVGGLPRPSRELAETALEVAVDQAGEHGAEVGGRIDAVQLAALDQRGQDGPVLDAFVGAGEQCVLAVQCDQSDRLLDRVLVVHDAAIVEKAGEALPAREGVADRLGQW
jgi:hypothetical protein